MQTQRHIVQRQILEIQLADAEQARQIQAALSRIQQRTILPILDRAFSALGGLDQLFRMDSLEVNLGVLDPDHLEAEVLAKLGPALEKALAQHQPITGPVEDRRPATTQLSGNLKILTHYARTGNLPWWADAGEPDLLATCLADLLVADAPSPAPPPEGASAGKAFPDATGGQL